ncbi:OmpA family protein [Roseibium sp. HPY-6]|uniref:OmpA family protein n=1 Tax=Roseibium sp. HPY-6 TaxID=3229852 RepID=UPI0033901983
MDTKSLQHALNRHVKPSPNLIVDGLLGPNTKAALKLFQRQSGLVPDGILGLRTLTALNHVSHNKDDSKVISRIEPSNDGDNPGSEHKIWRFEGFGIDSADLKETHRNVLREEVVPYVKKLPRKLIVLEGHTSRSGDAAYNKELSKRRTLSVRRFLTEHGVAAHRFGHLPYGESRSKASSSEASAERAVVLRLAERIKPPPPPPEPVPSTPGLPPYMEPWPSMPKIEDPDYVDLPVRRLSIFYIVRQRETSTGQNGKSTTVTHTQRPTKHCRTYYCAVKKGAKPVGTKTGSTTTTLLYFSNPIDLFVNQRWIETAVISWTDTIYDPLPRSMPGPFPSPPMWGGADIISGLYHGSAQNVYLD